ncbi:MAG: PAS domain S-box protein [Taibaiella sp.]|nr:PAS domain S-box protein [Taibaiella sp.]
MTLQLTRVQKNVLAYVLANFIFVVFYDKIATLAFFATDWAPQFRHYVEFSSISIAGILTVSAVGQLKTGTASKTELIARENEFYKSLIDHAGDLTAITDAEGNIRFIAPNIFNILGYSVEEIQNKTIFELVHPEEKEALILFNAEVANTPGKLFTYEARMRHNNGDYIWMEGTIINKINDSTIKGILTNARVITARKEAQDKMVKSEQLFSSAFEQVAVGMANINLSGQWLRSNSQLSAITGYSAAELASIDYHEFFLPADRSSVTQYVENVLHGEKENKCHQFRIIRKDKSLFWIELLLNLINDGQQHPQYLVVVVKDIDEAKKNELQLAYKKKELNTFIYRSSHDLRGPITTLLGLAEVALLDTPDERSREYFRDFHQVAFKMEQTLDDLMAVTRIKDNKITFAEVDPKSLIYTHLKSRKLEDIVRNAKIEVEVEPDCHYRTDEALLNIVLSHLLDNAFVFGKPETQTTVAVSFKIVDGLIRVKIADNGIGIAKEDMAHVFDLYYRGKNTQRGSGIGLYLVQSAIEKLNGTINIESQPEKGTIVTVTIPNKTLDLATFSTDPYLA